jgi:hypothetical protein
MAVRLSAIRTGRALLFRNIFWYLFLLEAEWTQGLVRPEGLSKIEKISVTSSGLEPAPFRLDVVTKVEK